MPPIRHFRFNKPCSLPIVKPFIMSMNDKIILNIFESLRLIKIPQEYNKLHNDFITFAVKIWLFYLEHVFNQYNNPGHYAELGVDCEIFIEKKIDQRIYSLITQITEYLKKLEQDIQKNLKDYIQYIDTTIVELATIFVAPLDVSTIAKDKDMLDLYNSYKVKKYNSTKINWEIAANILT